MTLHGIPDGNCATRWRMSMLTLLSMRQNHPDSNEDEEAAWPGGRADRTPRRRRWPEARCLNPHPEQVTDPEFLASDFFDARDAVQVKYEMVRKVRAGGAPVTEAAAAFGYSRPAYYAAAAALESSGLEGLVPARPGPRGGQQAHRGDPRLGRGAAGRRPRRCARRSCRTGSRTPSACACTPARSSERWPAAGSATPKAAELPAPRDAEGG